VGSYLTQKLIFTQQKVEFFEKPNNAFLEPPSYFEIGFGGSFSAQAVL